MIKLILQPQRADAQVSAGVAGDVLTLNAGVLDFSLLPDGATLPASAINNPWIAGDVQRINGVLHVPLLLPLGPDASEAARFPAPIFVTRDGPVELPR